MTWGAALLSNGWKKHTLILVRFGCVLATADSGNASCLKRVDGLQSGYVDMGKMTCKKLNGDYQALSGNAIIKGGNHLTR